MAGGRERGAGDRERGGRGTGERWPGTGRCMARVRGPGGSSPSRGGGGRWCRGCRPVVSPASQAGAGGGGTKRGETGGGTKGWGDTGGGAKGWGETGGGTKRGDRRGYQRVG